MPTIEQFREAMIIVQKYCDSINPLYSGMTNQIGCIVKLSSFGKSNLTKEYWNKNGTVVDWLEWHSPNDGLVTIKFDTIKKPVVMHIHNVTAVQKESSQNKK